MDNWKKIGAGLLIGISGYALYRGIKAWNIEKKSSYYIGTPYKWGMETPEIGFDCSGFTQYIYATYRNKQIPRVSTDQYKYSKLVKHPMIGDLVFFADPGCEVGHVGIYVGNGEMIHSGRSTGVIRTNFVNNSYWSPRFVAYGRY